MGLDADAGAFLESRETPVAAMAIAMAAMTAEWESRPTLKTFRKSMGRWPW